jgi:Glucose/sorbosone dehydrogenases
MRLLPVALLLGALSYAHSTLAADVQVQVLQDKLDHPWSVAFLPDNQTLLITERSGQLRSWQPGKGLSQPISGVPKVWANRQGGLLDVVLAPDFAQSRRVWLSYTTADARGERAGGRLWSAQRR